MLYFVFNPDVVAVVVAHDLRGDGEFVAQVPYFPPLQSLEDDFSHEECLRLVRAAAAGGRGGLSFADSIGTGSSLDGGSRLSAQQPISEGAGEGVGGKGGVGGIDGLSHGDKTGGSSGGKGVGGGGLYPKPQTLYIGDLGF